MHIGRGRRITHYAMQSMSLVRSSWHTPATDAVLCRDGAASGTTTPLWDVTDPELVQYWSITTSMI